MQRLRTQKCCDTQLDLHSHQSELTAHPVLVLSDRLPTRVPARPYMDNRHVIYGKSRMTCPFCEELDTILGSRAASSPALLLASGAAPSQSDNIHSPRSCGTGVEGDSEESSRRGIQ